MKYMTNPEIPRSDTLRNLERRMIWGQLSREMIDAVKDKPLAPDVTIGSHVETNIATGRWKYNEDGNLVIDYENIASRLSLNDEEQEALKIKVITSGERPENILKKIIRDGLGIVEKATSR